MTQENSKLGRKRSIKMKLEKATFFRRMKKRNVLFSASIEWMKAFVLAIASKWFYEKYVYIIDETDSLHCAKRTKHKIQ